MDDEIVTLTEKRFFEWYEDDKSVTLRNCGGSYGGGQRSACYCEEKCGSLCADDRKGVGNQYVSQGKLVVIFKDV